MIIARDPFPLLQVMIDMHEHFGTTRWLAHEGFVSEADLDAVLVMFPDAVVKTTEGRRPVYRLNLEWLEAERERQRVREALIERLQGADMASLLKVKSMLGGDGR